MWRRIFSSQLKSLATFSSSSSSRSASTPARLGINASSYVNRSSSVIPRHFSSADAAIRKTVEDVVPIATGHEREEIEADLQGKDILEINYPEGPFGTKEAPAVVKSYYDKRIVGCPGGEGEDEHDVVWFWLEKGKPHECPVCTQYFKERLLMNDLRARRGLTLEARCCFCGSSVEACLHAIRDCHIARQCWERLLPEPLWRSFFGLDQFRLWVEWNLKRKEVIQGFDWSCWFGVVTRQIWLNRNEGIFNQAAKGFGQLIQQSRSILHGQSVVIDSVFSETKRRVKWVAPVFGSVKYNVDGSCFCNENEVSCAGVTRDHDGQMLEGFMARLRRRSPLCAEISAVFWGLKRALDMGWRRVWIETDCWEVVRLLDGGWDDDHSSNIMLTQIQCWLEMDWDVQVTWCCREANCVADLLTQEARRLPEGIEIVSSAPSVITIVLEFDSVV